MSVEHESVKAEIKKCSNESLNQKDVISHHTQEGVSDLPPNNQQNSSEVKVMEKSITSGGYTIVANDYLGGMFDKVQDDYSNIIKTKSNLGESHVNSSNNDENNRQPSNNDSIEKRIEMDSSLGHNQDESGNMAVNIGHNESSSSTTKGMANDYVSNMIHNLY
mmetsp:Transcript_30176/g.26727  ORF Transcript_30176/g.26727 Transcript_30176/m.26727 type:complete len:163 (+) Transcript_30176:504-992(+)